MQYMGEKHQEIMKKELTVLYHFLCEVDFEIKNPGRKIPDKKTLVGGSNIKLNDVALIYTMQGLMASVSKLASMFDALLPQGKIKMPPGIFNN